MGCAYILCMTLVDNTRSYVLMRSKETSENYDTGASLKATAGLLENTSLSRSNGTVMASPLGVVGLHVTFPEYPNKDTFVEEDASGETRGSFPPGIRTRVYMKTPQTHLIHSSTY